MVLYLFDLDLEEECQRMQESNKNLFEELPHHTEENILVRVVMTLIMIGDHIEFQRPPERGRYQGQNGRPPDRRNYQDRGYSGEIIQVEMGEPLEEEDPLLEI